MLPTRCLKKLVALSVVFSHVQQVLGKQREAHLDFCSYPEVIIGDTLDWVNPNWLLTNQAKTDPTMVAARKQIISTANAWGTSPPWCQSRIISGLLNVTLF